MNAVLDLPKLHSRASAANSVALLEPVARQLGPQPEPAGPSLFATLLRTAILLAFAAGGLALIMFSLVPAVFLALIFFLPALAPLIVVALGIVFDEDAEHSRDRQHAVLDQPCSCHHDRMLRAVQNG